jgi:hypothetical protein
MFVYLSNEISNSKDNHINATTSSLLDDMKAQKDKMMMTLYTSKELMDVGTVDDAGS